MAKVCKFEGRSRAYHLRAGHSNKNESLRTTQLLRCMVRVGSEQDITQRGSQRMAKQSNFEERSQAYQH